MAKIRNNILKKAELFELCADQMQLTFRTTNATYRFKANYQWQYKNSSFCLKTVEC